MFGVYKRAVNLKGYSSILSNHVQSGHLLLPVRVPVDPPRPSYMIFPVCTHLPHLYGTPPPRISQQLQILLLVEGSRLLGPGNSTRDLTRGKLQHIVSVLPEALLDTVW